MTTEHDTQREDALSLRLCNNDTHTTSSSSLLPRVGDIYIPNAYSKEFFDPMEHVKLKVVLIYMEPYKNYSEPSILLLSNRGDKCIEPLNLFMETRMFYKVSGTA